MENYRLSWKNLIGNAETAEYLRKNISSGKFPHAVIFSGEEGVGKRFNNGEACGVCENCRLVLARSHPDFYILEPEDNKKANPSIKIGQIREMQSEAALRPINSERRVIIIDGAELMNNAAANCLLKTIEEPPSQTIFILLTANRSNLMTVNFDKISAEKIRDVLISRGVESKEAENLSIIADGSLGRALKLKESGGAQLRERALEILEKITRKELSSEEIFKFGAEIAEWTRENFADFVNYMQKILRDVCFKEIMELRNPDLLPRLNQLKIPERKLLLMIETGAEFNKRIKSNANLRLLAESYLFKLKKDLGA